ncbi:hypothetical protein AC611_12720 [Xanthomonas phaseoli pv. phaseoli]|nr:hypothetical protein AC609_12660 [Xanthomonas phaseoli pv. phaseoli]AZU26293.1 hypothetical protein AC611_12720 [Xanthomonas phaseoli pv. phaseoli]AZU36940.1 hypothetical protein AC610_23310 [Xanthomonas phaseoli pv. phaseoli]KKY06200.1 hypothetical protein RN19_24235 [Xanthomonas phaseoli pv. phaseoli]
MVQAQQIRVRDSLRTLQPRSLVHKHSPHRTLRGAVAEIPDRSYQARQSAVWAWIAQTPRDL